MDETSLSLLDRIRDTSDVQSWDRLVAIYAPLLERWMLRYEVQESEADDIAQEVLTVVSQEMPKFKHNERPGAFRSWLRRILVNRLRNHWRDRQHSPPAAGGSSFLEQLNQLEDETSQLSQIRKPTVFAEYLCRRELQVLW